MKTYLWSKFLYVIIFSNLLLGQNLLNGPECVSFDPLKKRFIVSNWTDGNIIQIDSSGNQSYFIKGLGHAYGNLIIDSVVYLSNGTSILALNLLNPADTVIHIQVPFASQMDGMVMDDNNNLFIVDVLQASVIKINLQNLNSSIFAAGLSARPQDIIFDKKNNRLLVCSWYSNSPIQAVSLIDSTVTDIISTIYGNCDGLAMDENGNVYFSTWTTNSVYFYDSTFTNPPTILSDGYNGPANISYSIKDKKILIPNFNSNTLSFFQLDPTSIENESAIGKHFNLTQNYPNPFNASTYINFYLPAAVNVSLKVYDILGNEIATLIDEYKQAGTHRVEFNRLELRSGVYFYQLKGRNFIQTKKMILLK